MNRRPIRIGSSRYVLVRQGVPGEHNAIAVAGTAGAAALCPNGIVND